MRKAMIVTGGVFLSISAAWGSGQLLMPIIGEWAVLVGIAVFATTVLIVDQAFPHPTPSPGQQSLY